MTGTLIVRGRSHPLAFDAQVVVHDEGEIGLDAEVRLNRADFRLTWSFRAVDGDGQHRHHPRQVHALSSTPRRADPRPGPTAAFGELLGDPATAWHYPTRPFGSRWASTQPAGPAPTGMV